MHFVIVGNGVAGITAAQAIQKSRPDADITVYSLEPYLYYPRPKLWDFLSGKISLEALYFHPREWYEERGIKVHLGVSVTEIDRRAKKVRLSTGAADAYDRLLLANGGLPFVPPIENVGVEGVFTLRNIDDALAIREYAARARTAVVIGGGLLGLESARGLKDLGLEVTVLEFFSWLLPKQLDEQGSEVLARQIEGMGIRTITGAMSEAIEGDGRAAGVRLKDGRHVPGDIVLVSAGVRPDVGLASAAGLQVERGVVVNEHLQTSDPIVYAAGDVAEFAGHVYGIIPAAVEQGRAAGTNMAGGDVTYTGTVPSNTLKVVGIDLTTIGTFNAPDDEYREYRVRDLEKGIYKKLVVNQNRLTGAILLGLPKEVLRISRLVRQAEPLEEPVEALLEVENT